MLLVQCPVLPLYYRCILYAYEMQTMSHFCRLVIETLQIRAKSLMTPLVVSTDRLDPNMSNFIVI